MSLMQTACNKVKPYRVIMNEQIHQNLKDTAKELHMTKGEFVLHLFNSFECQLIKYRHKIGFSESAGRDELDVRLRRFIMFEDNGVELEMKLEEIRKNYEWYLSHCSGVSQ